MSVVYLNFFDKLVQQTTAGDSSIVAINPDYDPGVWTQSLNAPPTKVHLGPMKPGTSVPTAAIGTMQFNPPHITFLPFQFDPGGLTVRVLKNPAPNTTVQSETVYLVFPNLVLQGSGTITAELIFDMPTAPATTSLDVWAVALNFKTGNQNDGGAADHVIGATCQFSFDGSIRFHGTDYPPKTTDAEHYAGFATYPPTQFFMRVELAVAQNTLSGTATLNYKNVTHTNNLLNPNNLDPASITAVGVALVTPNNFFASFGARLHSFSLSVSPWLLSARP